MTWQERAACAGIPDADEVFYPHVSGGRSVSDPFAAAKRLCKGCPVRNECLDYAMNNEFSGGKHRFGVWGGMTGDERQALVRRAKYVRTGS